MSGASAGTRLFKGMRQLTFWHALSRNRYTSPCSSFAASRSAFAPSLATMRWSVCTDVGTLTRGMPVVMNWRSTVCALASEARMDDELGLHALWQKARRILTMQGDPSRPETQLRAAALNGLLHIVEMTIENLLRER